LNFVAWINSHRRSILFLITLLALGGVVLGFQLPISLFPKVSFPRVQVNINAGDRPADLMVIQVTLPVEESVRSVPGVLNVRSTTSRGSAEISIDFKWGMDMIQSTLQIESAINQVISVLPQGVTFTVRRMDPTIFPVMAYSLTSDSHSLIELRDIALYQLRPVLSTVKGVADIGVQGGQKEEFRVTVDPARLNSFGLTITDVANALSASNVITAVGKLEDHYKLYLVVSDTRFINMSQIQNTVLRSGEDGVVLLEDIATVSSTSAPQWIRVTADGHDAVIFQIFQQPDGNTIQIARDIKSKLKEFSGKLPADVVVANWYDQTDLILSSAKSVRDSILIGVLLASFILLIFLRDIRTMLIAAIIVPSVLAATVLFLYVFQMSFNVMTLGGMAAAVGLIIDDTLVMVEHIIRRLSENTEEKHSKVMLAAREFTKPLSGSSASTIIIFAPLAFLSGVTGAFFKALSLTMAAGLLISFFVAWLALPLLADHLLKAEGARKNKNDKLTKKLHNLYDRFMSRMLRKPPLILVGIIPLLLLGWIGYKHTGSGFMPSVDEGGFILDYRSPSGTSLTETDRLLKQVEDIIILTPDVETYSRRTGLQLGGGLTEANQGDYFIKLKPFPRRPIETVMDDIRNRIENSVPGLEVEMAQLMEDLIGDLTAVPQPIEIKIYSDDEGLLKKLGPSVAREIGKIRGVVDVRDGIVLAGDAIEINIDRVKASLEGVDPESVTKTVSDYLSGVVTTQVEKGPKLVGVRVWVPKDSRNTVPDINSILISAPDGHLFPLKRIGNLSIITGQPQITRDNLKRMIAVTGRITGRDIGSAIKDVKKVLSNESLMPKNVYYSLGGLYAQQQIAFKGLVMVFVGAVFLVFLLLLFLYESFRVALVILSIPLLAISAVFLGLWTTGTELNISSMMGMTMIVGIVTEVAIFYVSEYLSQPSNIDPNSAYIISGQNRMRPIAMTTLATILALLPLALAIGQGSAMQQPLAIAIISGLIFQMPLVLIVLPVLLNVVRTENNSAKSDMLNTS